MLSLGQLVDLTFHQGFAKGFSIFVITAVLWAFIHKVLFNLRSHLNYLPVLPTLLLFNRITDVSLGTPVTTLQLSVCSYSFFFKIISKISSSFRRRNKTIVQYYLAKVNFSKKLQVWFSAFFFWNTFLVLPPSSNKYCIRPCSHYNCS